DAVGEIRGRGLLVGIELVADREDRRPFPRSAGVTERIVAAARDRGVLVYSGTGCADGRDGDTILLGPPFVVTDDELARIVDAVAESIEAVTQAIGSDGGAVSGGGAASDGGGMPTVGSAVDPIRNR